jgi:hypothetical protein
MKKYILLLLVILITGNSCNKFLTTVPLDSISPVNYYKTETDLNRALAGVYDRLGDVRLYGRGLYTYLAFDDEHYAKNQTSGYFANQIDASTLEINRCWETLYTGIERANMLLDNIGNASVSDAIRNEVKGQTLFMRAYYYFLLADMWGGVPLKLISTKSPTDKPLPRAPLADVYAQIVTDMKEAEGLVKTITSYGYNGKVSRTAVEAMLAKVYLTMAGYPLNDVAKYADAKSYAEKVIQSGEHALNTDYKQIFINHSQNLYDIKECLWEVEFYGDNQGVIKEGGSVGSYNGIFNLDVASGYGYDIIHATQTLYSAYATGDLRRDWVVAPYRYVVSGTVVTKTDWLPTNIYERSPGKWRREYEPQPRNQDYTPANFPLMRYSDVLLMYAEAENQINGPTTAAYNAINMVRRRGYGKPITVADVNADLPSALSKIDFQEAIKSERLRELAFEGVRKHDLIRWGIYVSTMQALVPYLQSTMPSTLVTPAVNQAKNVTSRSVLFPIPNSEIAVNPYATQNPGW